MTASAKRRKLIERIERGALPAPTPAELEQLRAPRLESGVLSKMTRRRSGRETPTER